MSGQLLLLKLNRYTCETCFRVLLIYNITGDKKEVCCKYYVGNVFLEDLTYVVIILFARNLNQQFILNRIFLEIRLLSRAKRLLKRSKLKWTFWADLWKNWRVQFMLLNLKYVLFLRFSFSL
jgi:hypothetical protein